MEIEKFYIQSDHNSFYMKYYQDYIKCKLCNLQDKFDLKHFIDSYNKYTVSKNNHYQRIKCLFNIDNPFNNYVNVTVRQWDKFYYKVLRKIFHNYRKIVPEFEKLHQHTLHFFNQVIISHEKCFKLTNLMSFYSFFGSILEVECKI